VVNFGGGDVDEVGRICVDVKTSGGADDFPALMEDCEAVAEDGGVGGVGCQRQSEQRRAQAEF
jgi:hypothetical protein